MYAGANLLCVDYFSNYFSDFQPRSHFRGSLQIVLCVRMDVYPQYALQKRLQERVMVPRGVPLYFDYGRLCLYGWGYKAEALKIFRCENIYAPGSFRIRNHNIFYI